MAVLCARARYVVVAVLKVVRGRTGRRRNRRRNRRTGRRRRSGARRSFGVVVGHARYVVVPPVLIDYRAVAAPVPIVGGLSRAHTAIKLHGPVLGLFGGVRRKHLETLART